MGDDFKIASLTLSSNKKEATVRNCANYGSVTHSGTANYVCIGGIAGESQESSSNKVCIQNCLSYGTINHNGTTTDNLYIGGILGCAWCGTNSLENCVSGGKIISNKESNYMGSVIGFMDSKATTTITHCYWSSDVGCDSVYGIGSPTIDTETKEVSLNIATVDSLNSYNSTWSKWLLNTNNRTVTFKVNNCKSFNLSSQLILLPDFTGDGENHTFSGWFYILITGGSR